MPITNLDELDKAMIAVNQAWDAADLAQAEALFRAVWADIPAPRKDYDCAQILAGEFIDFLTATGQHHKAIEAVGMLREAYDAAEGINAHVDFVAASVAYDGGDIAAARRIFANLVSKFGKRPFAGKDPKYLAFATAGN